jgi:4a-hydroxytetrahydrobiopterin dehydratase
MAVLTEQQLSDALAALGDGWSRSADGAAITRTFVFSGFNAAFGFMTRCALAAEKADHHPDWRNVYRTVEVMLSTHDSGGITDKDISLAKLMNKVAEGQTRS